MNSLLASQVCDLSPTLAAALSSLKLDTEAKRSLLEGALLSPGTLDSLLEV